MFTGNPLTLLPIAALLAREEVAEAALLEASEATDEAPDEAAVATLEAPDVAEEAILLAPDAAEEARLLAPEAREVAILAAPEVPVPRAEVASPKREEAPDSMVGPIPPRTLVASERTVKTTSGE